MISLNHVIEVGLLIFAAYLGGCTLGYSSRLLMRRLLKRQSKAHETVAAAPPPAVAPMQHSSARRLARVVEDRQDAVAAIPSRNGPRRPPELPAPRYGRADELRKIKGIGQKTESSLHDLGIYHFEQIAAWQPGHVEWLEGRIAVKGRISREQWVEQATLLFTELRSDAA